MFQDPYICFNLICFMGLLQKQSHSERGLSMNIEKRTENLPIVRKMNKVPGVLFGKSITPVSIQMDELELQEIYRINGKTQTFTVKLGKETHTVYIKNIQKDIINRNHILNVELLKVGKGDMITAKIPLHIIGKEIIEHQGHLVQVVGDDIEVEYEAGKGISRIDVDISNMKVKETLHIHDVQFPQGIKVIDDVDKVLIVIAEPRIIEEVAEKTEEKTEAPVSEEPKSKEENKR
jgi:large subunit ribosomal protein L25